mgnify:CR=1 FL=1
MDASHKALVALDHLESTVQQLTGGPFEDDRDVPVGPINFAHPAWQKNLTWVKLSGYLEATWPNAWRVRDLSIAQVEPLPVLFRLVLPSVTDAEAGEAHGWMTGISNEIELVIEKDGRDT